MSSAAAPRTKDISYEQYTELVQKQQKNFRSYLEEKKKAAKRQKNKTPRCIFCGAAIGMDFTIDPESGRMQIRCGGEAAARVDGCGYEFDLQPPTIITPLIDSPELRESTDTIVRRLYFLQKRAILEGGEVSEADEREWGELVEVLQNLSTVLERQDDFMSGVRDEEGQRESRTQIQQELYRMFLKRSEANADETKLRDYVRQLIESKEKIRECKKVLPVERDVVQEADYIVVNGLATAKEGDGVWELMEVDKVGLSHVVLNQGKVQGDLVREL